MGLLDQLSSVITEREDNYDNPLPNFLRIALYWSLWLELVITPLDVIFMMDLMKTTREKHNHKDDNLLDKTGYTVSVYERMDEAMKSLGYADGVEEFRHWKDTHKGSTAVGLVVGLMFDLLINYKDKQNELHGSGA